MQIRSLGLQAYEPVLLKMQQFAVGRTSDTEDELWVLEHPAVYTLGLNGKIEHLLNPTPIPVIHCDRGGQITYHGPGQVIIYPLLDIKRLGIGIRQLVTILEQAMIKTLAQLGVSAVSKNEAPGVYVADKKIGSIGLRIKNNSSYHGISLNNHMDLTPFQHINTCGFKNLQVTQLADLGVTIETTELAFRLVNAINTSLAS